MIKKNIVFFLWIILHLIGGTLIAKENNETEVLKYEENKLYIKYKTNFALKNKAKDGSRKIQTVQLPKIKQFIQKYGIHIQALSMSLLENENLNKTVQIEFDSLQKINTLIEELERDPNVEYVERIPLYRLFLTNNEDPLAKELGGRNLKWHLDLIRAQEAWNIQKASSAIKVAVVDNAVWGEHEDLQILPENQYSIVAAKQGSSAPPSAIEQGQDCKSVSNCPAYRWSHGTHCAGIVGAINHNGKGVSSIGSGLSLMGIAIESLPGGLYMANAFDGILWAAENGADVISCSWGGGALSRTHAEILKACYQKGIILVFAAGNSNSSQANYPAASPFVISVGSVNSNKSPSFSSNHGTWIDIAAPGGFEVNKEGRETENAILSTTFCKNQKYRLNKYPELTGLYYDGMAGTSMAAPMVAGLVGLLLSKDSTLNTSLMKDILMQSGQALNYLDPRRVFNAESSIIDAKGALDYMDSIKTYPDKLSAVLKNRDVHISWEAPAQTKKTPAYYKLYRNRELIDEHVTACLYVDAKMENGEYEYGIQAVYEDGSVSLKNGVGISVAFYTLEVDIRPAMAGNIENCGNLYQNEVVELLAHANTGYEFVAWKVKDEIISRDTILPILLVQDTSLIAEFKTRVGNEKVHCIHASTFFVSPNPAKKQIEILSDETSFDYISIVNMMGKEVLHIHKTASVFISIASLPQGLYFLQARKANRKYITKFIKK